MTVLMTGSHFLTDLRDGICCVSDLQVCGEFSFSPDMAPDFISKVSIFVQYTYTKRLVSVSQ